jgi:hypothetical protein
MQMNNEHPLADDPTKLSDEQLETRIFELTKRWHTARRMNWNQNMMNQLDLLLQGLEYERSRRSQRPDTGGQVLDTDWVKDSGT